MLIDSSVNLSACKENGFTVLLSENLTWDIANNRFGGIGPKSIMDQHDINSDKINASSPTKLGILAAFVLAIFINYKTNYVKSVFETHIQKWTRPKNSNCTEYLFQISCFLVFVLVLPFLVYICLVFAVYKKWIERKLKKKYGSEFKGLLEGSDVVWALEADSSKSVINIIGFLHADENSHTNRLPAAEIVLALRKRIANKLMGLVQPHPKMFYRRQNDMGFYFWTHGNDCSVEEYIRYMDYIPQKFSFTEDNMSVTEEALKAHIAQYCNLPLPHNHQTSWEILVGKQPMREKIKDKSGSRKIFRYPVLFRCHHSLGDGVALLRLLLETIADKDSPSLKMWRKYSTVKSLLSDTDSDLLEFQEKFSQTQTWLERMKDTFMKFNFAALPQKLYQRCLILFLAPSILFYQGALKAFDKNPIHGPELSGKKVVGWYHEPENEGRLLATVKIIKQHIDGARFSDVLLTALSKSLHRYFSKKISDAEADDNLPKEITVVLPIRMESEGVQLKIHNRFSVALQTLPIVPGSANIDMSQRLEESKEHIESVKKFTDILRSAPDYLINYWIMSFLSSLFPDNVLKKIVKSEHSTMAISNLPGPQQTVTIQKYELKNLCFWIPNIGTTGVGITVLSFRDHLQLGLMADQILIRSNKEAQIILDQMIEEIHLMGEIFH